MISSALLLTTIAAVSAAKIKFPSTDSDIPRRNISSNNDTIIVDTEPVCNDFHISLDGEMLIHATAANTFNFDWSHLLEGLDWSQGNVNNCIFNVSLLQTISSLNETKEAVIENIPVDKLNQTLDITNKNFDECQGGLEFSIKFFLSNSEVVMSNTTTYEPKFINSSEPWPSICKLTKDHGREHHTVIYLNTFQGINQVLIHCIKSMILHEIEEGEETEGYHRSTLEDDDMDKIIVPELNTKKIRLEYFHDFNSTMLVSGLVNQYELNDLPPCPAMPEEVTAVPKRKIRKNGKYIFIALGVVLVLALLVFVTRIHCAKKTMKRAASAKYKADSIARESPKAPPRESTEAILVDI